MSEDKQTKWYEKTSNVILLVVGAIGAWFVIAQWWGFIAVRNDQGDSIWSPALLGDSFGFINAILTAAAFIAVVLTYRKEQEQLAILKQEKHGREIEAKQREQAEFKRYIHDNLKLCLQVHADERARIIERVRRGEAYNWKRMDHYRMLEFWCKSYLELSDTGIVTSAEEASYFYLLHSYLSMDELAALQVIAEQDSGKAGYLRCLLKVLKIKT